MIDNIILNNWLKLNAVIGITANSKNEDVYLFNGKKIEEFNF